MKICCYNQPHCHSDDLFGNVCSFDTTLLFPIDDPISAYLQTLDKDLEKQNESPVTKRGMVVLDGVEHYPIGYLTIEIRVANTYGRLCINTVSMSQNEMMLHSVSIRNAMKQLLCAHEGVVGLIDLVADDYRYPLLLKTRSFYSAYC